MRILGLVLRSTNDILHDVAAGVWPGAVLALWMVRRGAGSIISADAVTSLAASWTWILTVLLVAGAVQIATGVARLYYHYMGVEPEAKQSRGRAALGKHAVFVSLSVLAVVYGFLVLQP